MVFSHGAMMDHRMFDDQVPAVTERYQVHHLGHEGPWPVETHWQILGKGLLIRKTS